MIKGTLTKIRGNKRIGDTVINAVLKYDTGELFYNKPALDLDVCESVAEYFDSDDGKIHEDVCQICHKYITRQSLDINNVEDCFGEETLVCANGCNE